MFLNYYFKLLPVLTFEAYCNADLNENHLSFLLQNFSATKQLVALISEQLESHKQKINEFYLTCSSDEL